MYRHRNFPFTLRIISLLSYPTCAYATQRNYQKISQLLFKNKQLVQVAEQHTQWAEEYVYNFNKK